MFSKKKKKMEIIDDSIQHVDAEANSERGSTVAEGFTRQNIRNTGAVMKLKSASIRFSASGTLRDVK